MDEPVIYLLDLTCYVPGTGLQVLRYCTGKGYVTQRGDTPADTWYEPRLQQPGLFRQDMYSEGATSGASRGGAGDIILDNSDGALDALLDYGFDGRPVVVREGYASWPFSRFNIVITGTAEQPLPTWSSVTIRLRDRSAELAVPVQLHRYLGNNVLPDGLEGVADLQGKWKPRLLGICNNISPPCVNTSKLIYQANDGPMTAVPNVYDSGVPLTRGDNYASQDDLLATAPAAGEFRAWLAGGYFRLGSMPAGQVTCDGRAVPGGNVFYPTALTLTAGVIASGSLSRFPLIINDGATNPGMDVELAFSGVTKIGSLNVSAAAGTPDGVTISIYDFSIGQWHQLASFGGMSPPSYIQTLSFTDEGRYIGSGAVRIRFYSPNAGDPSHALTIDALSIGSEAKYQTVGQIARQLVAEPMGIDSIVEQAIIDLDAVAAGAVGLFTGTDTMLRPAALDMLGASVGAWWGFDNRGSFWIRQLQAPSAAEAVLTIDGTTAASIDRLATGDSDRGLPAWRATLKYARNWTVQTSGLAGSVNSAVLLDAPVPTVTSDRAAALAMEYQQVEDSDPSVLDLHPLAADLTITSLLVDHDPAQAEVTRQVALRKTRRDRMRVKCHLQAIAPTDGSTWDDASITDLPFGLRSAGSVVYGSRWYLFGGYGASGPVTATSCLDMSTQGNNWFPTAMPDLPEGRYQMGVVTVGSKVFVIGGYTSGGITPSVIRSDLLVGGWWLACTDLPEALAPMIWGNYGSYIYVVLADGMVIRADSNQAQLTWETIAPGTPGIMYQGGAIIDNWLYACSSSYDWVHKSVVVSLLRLDLDNPSAGFQTLNNLPTGSDSAQLVAIGSMLYAVGDTAIIQCDTTQLAAGWITPPGAALPTARTQLALGTYNGSVLLAGGTTTGTDQLATTMIWRGPTAIDATSRVYDLGRALVLKTPRYGYESGRPMRVIGTEVDYAGQSMTLDLWG